MKFRKLKCATQQKFNSELRLVTQTSTQTQEQLAIYKSLFESKSPFRGTGGLYFKFISHSLYGSDAIDAEFLADLSDMYVDRAVTNNYIIAPNLAKNFIS